MDSPFGRSSKIVRSPPPTPRAEQPPMPPPPRIDVPIEAVKTVEIQNWMDTIEQCLNEVCSIASDGKLNSDQKLKINNLCRKVGHGTSQMAVEYQALKQKTIQAHAHIQALKDRQNLSERLHDLRQSIEESSLPSSKASFADMVKKSTNNYIRPTQLSSVAIYPKDKLKSSEETKSLVQKIISPEEMKLHVRGLRKTINGGVIISTDTKDDIEKLKNSVHLSSSALTIDEPKRRRPRIVVIGVPSSMQEREVYKCMYEQNLCDKLIDMSRDQFLAAIKLSHKSGRKGAESCNYIIEVSPTIRKALITQDRVFVNWCSCPVRDFTFVTRCFKCQQYGHAAKTCRADVYTCGHCGDLGHQSSECTKKEQASKCATCLRYKKPSDHKTGDPDCPAKKIAEQRYINSTDYEGA